MFRNDGDQETLKQHMVSYWDVLEDLKDTSRWFYLFDKITRSAGNIIAIFYIQ